MHKKVWPSKSELKTCKSITKKHNKNYFFIKWFFPKKIAQSIQVIYAFCNTSYNLINVQSTNNQKIAKQALSTWELEWKTALQNNTHQKPVLSAAAKLHNYYHIPSKYSIAFLQSIKQDLSKTRYNTMQELTDYMFNSAATIGIMITHILGQKNRKIPDKQTLELTEKLSYAIQLTNFYRQAHQDITQRNHIYLPQAELQKYGCDQTLIEANRYTKKWEAFMFDQVGKCHKLYQEANKGIKNLTKKGQFTALFISNLYRHYLTLIKKSQFKVYHNNYEIPFFVKLKIAIKTRLKQKINY